MADANEEVRKGTRWRFRACGVTRGVLVFDTEDDNDVNRYYIQWGPHRFSGVSPQCAVMMYAVCVGFSDVSEILAPGELTRAELVAQLAAMTGERDAIAGSWRAEILRVAAAARAACVAQCEAIVTKHLVAWFRYGHSDRLPARAQGAEECVNTLRAGADETRDSALAQEQGGAVVRAPAPLREENEDLRAEIRRLRAEITVLRGVDGGAR